MSDIAEVGYTGVYKVRTSEIDIYKKIKIPALIQLMQEASMSNALKLKVSVWDLEDKALSWVLVKKEIHITTLPLLGEKIKITTYPSGLERLFAYRDFIVKDESDNIIVTASSTWILMNTDTRKIVKPELKIPTPSDVIPLARPHLSMPKLDKSILSKSFEVNWHDLDWNKHVNNVFIFKCILDSLPDEKIVNGVIATINIQFKSESFWKDKLTAKYYIGKDGNTFHSVIREKDNKVITLAEISWK